MRDQYPTCPRLIENLTPTLTEQVYNLDSLISGLNTGYIY